MIDASYEPFSREREYIEVNRLFIESLDLGADARVLDLACGTGTLTAIILAELHAKLSAKSDRDHVGERRMSIVGADICQESLRLAERYLADIEAPDRQAVGWLEATAESLPLESGCVDVVIIGNAIQLFEYKDDVVKEVRRVLAPGGGLAFNTSFYAGTFVPGTEQFYLRWVQKALEYIQERDAERRKQGLGRIRRTKGLAKPAFSNPWLSRSEYEFLIVRNGFRVKSVKERTVMLTQHSFETIGSYAGLASVLLSGYPVEISTEALAKSAGSALIASNFEAIPRRWIEFIAVKK
jgi:ubiquinone/menaquinone biosynthesis C-methylase UbiE